MHRTCTLAALFVALFAAVGGAQGDDMIQIPSYDWIKMSIMSGMGLDLEDASDDLSPKRVSQAAPPVPAYMGSLDYGGQPPSYKLSEIKVNPWSVDRSKGAPAPLRLSPTKPAEAPASAPQQAEQPAKQHASGSGSGTGTGSGSGFNLFRTVLRMAGRAVQATGRTVGRVTTGVGKAVESVASRRWPSLPQPLSGLPLIGK